MRIANDFIKSSYHSKYTDWNQMRIVDHYALYDFNDNISGYIFHVTDDVKNGFVLVQYNGREFVVSKACADGMFEYSDLLHANIRVYSASPFNFFRKLTGRSANIFLNLATGESIVIDTLESLDIDVDSTVVTYSGSVTEGPDFTMYAAGPSFRLPTIKQSQKRVLLHQRQFFGCFMPTRLEIIY